MSSQNLSTSQDGAPEEEDTYIEPSNAELLPPPPNFKPFFTIIEDPETGSHHHPAVHYIFADDDLDHLTTTLLEATDQTSEIEERVVLLDLDKHGSTVLNAASLSPQWQALSANIGQAPTWGNDTSGSQTRMLKISGHGRNSSADVSGRDVEVLAGRFSRRLVELERALEMGTEDMADTSKRV